MNMLHANRRAARWAELLLPYRQFSVETPLSPEQVRERLACDLPCRVRDWFRLGGWRGRATTHAFWMRRNISYRNGFQPIVEGQLEPTPAGTRVDVTMRLPRTVLAATVLLCTLPVGLALKGQSQPVDLVWMLGLTIAMMLGGFGYEARKARQYLSLVLDTPRGR